MLLSSSAVSLCARSFSVCISSALLLADATAGEGRVRTGTGVACFLATDFWGRGGFTSARFLALGGELGPASESSDAFRFFP